MLQSKLLIPVFYGTYADLTKLDLSFVNAKIVIYKGKKFRECLMTLLAEADKNSYNYFTTDHTQNYVYESKQVRKYAIVPIDPNLPFNETDWNHFYELMISLYPSDFALLDMFHLSLNNDKYSISGRSEYTFKRTGKTSYENFMFFNKEEYTFTRKYLQKYFHSSLHLKYVKYILSVYANSFLEVNPIYQYISLIICLEVIVDGKEQLTYRLKRNTALLCGKNVEGCKRIFSNIDQLYKLRSAIVHGQINPSYRHFKEYYEYLKRLVARLIRELIAHNIPTITELNEKITILGYGQNKELSYGYIDLKYPILDSIHLNYRAIQKY